MFSNGNNSQNNTLDSLEILPYGLQPYRVFAKCCGTCPNWEIHDPVQTNDESIDFSPSHSHNFDGLFFSSCYTEFK